MCPSYRSNSLPGEYVTGCDDLIKHARSPIDDTLASISPFVQMIVLDVIFDPTIIDENMKEFIKSLNVMNVDLIDSIPRNTIIGKQIADGSPGSERPPMLVYPFFSHLSLPIKPGEHVWVLLYPNLEKKVGNVAYWMSRVVEPHVVDDVNHTHSPRVWDTTYVKGTKDQWETNTDIKYGYPNGRLIADNEGQTSLDAGTAPLIDSPFSDKIADAYVDLQKKTNAGKISTIEPVPRYRKRPQDLVIEGSNNTVIVLGTDRTDVVAEYDVDPDANTSVAKFPTNDLTGEAGAIDIIVGRGQTSKTLGKTAMNDDVNAKEIAKSLKNDDPDMRFEGDPDIKNDRTRFTLSQRMNVDAKFGLTTLNELFNDIEDQTTGTGASVIKSDKVRLIARSDVEILVTGFELDENGKMVELTDPESMAAIVLRKNGDIVFRPSKKGVIKLGGDNADKALLCTDEAAIVNAATGDVSANTIVSTAGGQLGNGNKHGSFAKKILVEG